MIGMSDKLENFSTCFMEHLQPFHNKTCNSNFSKHLLENQHPIDTINKIMEILYKTRKGAQLSTVKKYYIYVINTFGASYLNTQGLKMPAI